MSTLWTPQCPVVPLSNTGCQIWRLFQCPTNPLRVLLGAIWWSHYYIWWSLTPKHRAAPNPYTSPLPDHMKIVKPCHMKTFQVRTVFSIQNTLNDVLGLAASSFGQMVLIIEWWHHVQCLTQHTVRNWHKTNTFTNGVVWLMVRKWLIRL